MEDNSYYSSKLTATVRSHFGNLHQVEVGYTTARAYVVLYIRMTISILQILFLVSGIAAEYILFANNYSKAGNLIGIATIFMWVLLWIINEHFKIDTSELTNPLVMLALILSAASLLPLGDIFSIVMGIVIIAMLIAIPCDSIYWDGFLVDAIEQKEINDMRKSKE